MTQQMTVREALELREKQQNASAIDPNDIVPMRIQKKRQAGAMEVYYTGARFRVIKEGARFEGIVTWGEKHYAGWSRPLEVGEIIECNGWREGLAGGGFMEANFTAERVPDNARWVQVWPQASLWRPWPLDGYLEPIGDGA
jgi:hypothetical protein